MKSPLAQALSSVETPWGPVGYLTYKRTYARRLDDNDPDSPTEEFDNTIVRCVEACNSQLECGFTEEEQAQLGKYLKQLKISVAGRFWWQLGTRTVDRLGLLSLQNCAFTVVDGPIDPFCWTFDALMLGSGVGYNIQREYVYQIPEVKPATVKRCDTKDADFIVPDSREGWTELLRRVLTAHFVTGKNFTFSTVCIRGKGAPIASFGGTASGPEELCWGMEQISKILNSRAGKKVRPIDCLDLMNIIGYIVVAGNVRRSAQIALGDMDDLQFLNAKRWDLGTIPSWRAMSNNSVICNDFALLPQAFWEGYKGNGEPYGLINLKLSQSCGRIGETWYPDRGVKGFNPCAEQSLEDKETCCLAEVFLPNIDTYQELQDVLKYVYRINKHSLRLKCHQAATETVVHRNMRMGIGITGACQASEDQLQWLSPAYLELRGYDRLYSDLRGWPRSIKLTTVKPSGTLSLLAGVTPGCHPGYAQYFIRRIRVAANSPLVDVCRSHGFPIEPQRNFDGTADSNTMVVSFPCAYPPGTRLAKDTTATNQLELVKRLQTEWSDNAVSCTIYYRKEELSAIQEWLTANYNSSVKSCSFLLHSDHGFIQAPYEEITKEEYDRLSATCTPIKPFSFLDDGIDSSDCDSGACPVK